MKLPDLRGPEQLQDLTLSELSGLAEEIRQELLHTVARTGGHLAPNLGTVELTLALHTVFKSPADRILWDVSHQSYPHKLLTGRQGRFHTLRQYGGVAGFTHPQESPHDHFHWGHASTSISAALGMAKARDLSGDHFDVVAVIGDGALTGGLAYEALNHGGQARTRVIVVLNDNSMSIAANVGGISQLLARIRTGPGYQALKHQTSEFLKHIPLVGPPALEVVDRWKESVKHFFLPTMFFEDLGWTYLGPVEGHNIPALQAALRQAQGYGGPVVVHVVTTKGKGVTYAEELPEQFHGSGPFDIKTGKTLASATTFSQVFADTLARLARTDQRVVAITAAMPSGTGLSTFAQEFPHRCFDVGIAEQHATAFAAGLAKQGLRPVFAVYSTFLQRAYDQVVHDVVVQGLPVLFAIDRAGLVEDGATHQGLYDLAYLRCLPNIVLGVPKDENELQHMLYTGLRQPGPFALRYPRGKAAGVPMDSEWRELPIGKAEMLREGRDVVFLALGTWVYTALSAADLLAAEGISAGVVNPRWVKPLDGELIAQLGQAVGALVTVEEAALPGGFGSAVLECLSDAGVAARVRRVGVPDQLVAHGAPKLFHEQFGLTPAHLADAARELVAAEPRPQSGPNNLRRPGRRFGRLGAVASGEDG